MIRKRTRLLFIAASASLISCPLVFAGDVDLSSLGRLAGATRLTRSLPPIDVAYDLFGIRRSSSEPIGSFRAFYYDGPKFPSGGPIPGLSGAVYFTDDPLSVLH
jgi:hypothetical protein